MLVDENKPKVAEQQIAFVLKQADDGVSVEDTRRKAGIPTGWPRGASVEINRAAP